MNGPAPDRDAAIAMAAGWINTTDRERIRRPIVPLLRETFGLSYPDCIEAIREAQRRRGGVDDA